MEGVPEPNLKALKATLRTSTIFDGRNLYDPHQLTAAGLTYLGVGRNNLALLAEAQAELQHSQAQEASQSEVRVGRTDAPDASVSKTM